MARAAPRGPPHQAALYIGHGGRFEFQTPTVATVREQRAPDHLNESNGDTSPSNGPIWVTQGGKGQASATRYQCHA